MCTPCGYDLELPPSDLILLDGGLILAVPFWLISPLYRLDLKISFFFFLFFFVAISFLLFFVGGFVIELPLDRSEKARALPPDLRLFCRERHSLRTCLKGPWRRAEGATVFFQSSCVFWKQPVTIKIRRVNRVGAANGRQITNNGVPARGDACIRG